MAKRAGNWRNGARRGLIAALPCLAAGTSPAAASPATLPDDGPLSLAIAPDPAGLPTLPAEYGEAFERQFDGVVAATILSMRVEARLAGTRPALTAASGVSPPYPRPDGLPRASGRLGSEDGLTLGFASRFAQDDGLVTDLTLGHRTGPVDMRFDLSGKQALSGGQTMQLAYNGSALVDVTNGLRLGMVARGGLGSVLDPALSADQHADAVARLNLPGSASTLSAETGVDLLHRQIGQSLPPAFHLNIALHMKL